MSALSDAALLARFGWLPDPAAVAEVRRTALVQEGPVLPPLTHAQIREALAFPDTPEKAARSPWWPEEAA